ncbi:MAG: hypothetical protein JO072_10920 [Parafilimonas sp.]|nr:hypothetical protein [Parafilimonas sp.]
MYRKRKRVFFELPFIIIAVVLLVGLVVMLLWNFIFPTVLHTERINYLQAVALFVLCRILFFGFRRQYNSKPNMWRGNPQWRQRWMQMNDEERAKFREEWKKRCGPPSSKNE